MTTTIICALDGCVNAFVPRTHGASTKRYCSRRCKNVACNLAYRAAHKTEIAAQKADYHARNGTAILARHAARRAERRAECIAYLGGRCAMCGATEELDIDHRNPAKKSFNISKYLISRWAIIEPELRKCQLLCRPCHILKTERECPAAARMLCAAPRGGSRGKAVAKWTHGSYSGYHHHGCRCEPCKTTGNAHRRDRYAKKRQKGPAA
jgi:hypothetical protein